MDITVNMDGTILSGRAPAVTERFADEAAHAIAAQALADVHAIANTSFRNPTPYYETQLNIRRDGRGGYVVNDRRIVYGPWLEGVSARNRASRFKGYAMFRRTRQQLDAEVPRLLAYAQNRLIRELGG